MSHLSPLIKRILKDTIRYPDATQICQDYTSEERLDIIKFFDQELEMWPVDMHPYDLLDHSDINHLRYFADTHPEHLDISDNFYDLTLHTPEIIEFAIDFAIKELNQLKSSDRSIVTIIKNYDLIASDYNLTRLGEVVVKARETFKDQINLELMERQRLQNIANNQRKANAIDDFNEARKLLQNPKTAFQARNLVRKYEKYADSIGITAREIIEKADSYDNYVNDQIDNAVCEIINDK